MQFKAYKGIETMFQSPCIKFQYRVNAFCVIYIMSIPLAKDVQRPGNANQKNCLYGSYTSRATMITNHIKKYNQYFPVDVLASMYCVFCKNIAGADIKKVLFIEKQHFGSNSNQHHSKNPLKGCL
jgi:hypothetical protein